MFSRPLHRFVAKTVAVCTVASVAFHVAMDNALHTRPPRKEEEEAEAARRRHREELVMMYGSGGGEGCFAEERREAPPEAVSRVANQNEAFRRFLAGLDEKDNKTKIEEAAQGIDYFMRPHALDADVKLKRVQRPTDPLPHFPSQQTNGTTSVPGEMVDERRDG